MLLTKLEFRDKQICRLSIIFEVASNRDQLWKTVRLRVMSTTVALLRAVKSSWQIVRFVQIVTTSNGSYSEHIRSVHLIMISQHSVSLLRFVRSVRSVRIVTVRMLRAVDGSYAPHKPSESLTLCVLSTYRACISLWHQGTVCYRFIRSVRIVTVRILDWYGPY